MTSPRLWHRSQRLRCAALAGCVVAACLIMVVWNRSHGNPLHWASMGFSGHDRSGTLYAVYSQSGHVRVHIVYDPVATLGSTLPHHYSIPNWSRYGAVAIANNISVLGFRIGNERLQAGPTRLAGAPGPWEAVPEDAPSFAVAASFIEIPYWFLIALPLTLGGRLSYLLARQGLWQNQGRCRHCGYDLRAHHPGQLCPECGSAVPADPLRKPIA